MYLSYSGCKVYRTCKRQYWHQYIDKTKTPTPDNRVNALYGSVIGTVFEHFYADGIWREANVEAKLQALVEPIYDKIVNDTRDGVILWSKDDKKANYASKEKLLADVREAIPRGLKTIREHRLLGSDAKAEVKLDSIIQGHSIVGRADFIMRRVKPYEDVVILDGKGSKWRDKYTDPQQLLWYAMLYRKTYRHIPDKLGFVYWRFEHDNAVDWIPFDTYELDELEGTVLGYIGDIEEAKTQLSSKPLQETFPASPGGDCKLCSYASMCPEGLAYTSLVVPQLDIDGVDEIGF